MYLCNHWYGQRLEPHHHLAAPRKEGGGIGVRGLGPQYLQIVPRTERFSIGMDDDHTQRVVLVERRDRSRQRIQKVFTHGVERIGAVQRQRRNTALVYIYEEWGG